MNTNARILFYTLKENSLFIASADKNRVIIPGLNINKLDSTKTIAGINHILKKIHVEYTDISFDWSVYKFVDIDLFKNLNNEIEMDIYYCVFIPPTIKLNNAYWIDAELLIPQYPMLRKLLCLI